jgi:hypothetical protein
MLREPCGPYEKSCFSSLVLRRTPGARAAKFMKFRVACGRLWICSVVTFVATSDVRTSTSGAASAVTPTVAVVIFPGLRSKLDSMTWPT